VGEKKLVNFIYFFTLETIIKMHESIFGMIIYSLLMQFSCLNFENILGIMSFILSLAVLIYVTLINYYIYSVFSRQDV
jgi:hypothetical protein